MRHKKKKKIFGRKKAPKELMLRNLAASIIIYEKVKTTTSKAKVVRSLVEKSITLAKKNDLSSRRMLLKILPQKMAVKKLMESLNKRYSDKKSGYTRITKIKSRQGDGAEMSQIELI
jgi:large subunit ribosomal protein L17